MRCHTSNNNHRGEPKDVVPVPIRRYVSIWFATQPNSHHADRLHQLCCTAIDFIRNASASAGRRRAGRQPDWRVAPLLIMLRYPAFRDSPHRPAAILRRQNSSGGHGHDAAHAANCASPTMISADTPRRRVTREIPASTAIRDNAEIRYAVTVSSTDASMHADRPRTGGTELPHQ